MSPHNTQINLDVEDGDILTGDQRTLEPVVPEQINFCHP